MIGTCREALSSADGEPGDAGVPRNPSPPGPRTENAKTVEEANGPRGGGTFKPRTVRDDN
jgi:hypothetical protein